MLIELFVFFEVVIIILFFTAFFTKQEILWALTLILSGVLMFTSYDIQTFVYQYNTSMLAYVPVLVSHNYPYLTAINMIFFALAILLGLFDLFDKYGTKLTGKN